MPGENKSTTRGEKAPDLSVSRQYLLKIILYSLAEELLAKESIGLPDIIKILGERPFPMKEHIKEYLEELQERSDKETAQSAAVDAESTA